MAVLKWEMVGYEDIPGNVYRAKVPGGWLVAISNFKATPSITFYPDPDHVWDGDSLP